MYTSQIEARPSRPVIIGRRLLADRFNAEPRRHFCMAVTTARDFAAVMGWPDEWVETVGARYRFVQCGRYACYRTPIVERMIWPSRAVRYLQLQCGSQPDDAHAGAFFAEARRRQARGEHIAVDEFDGRWPSC